MTLQEVTSLVTKSSLEEAVKTILERDAVAVFPSPNDYERFRTKIRSVFQVDEIFVMGSANLGFSLSPEKLGRPFRTDSDIDVVLISEPLFFKYWELLRVYHRTYYYELDRYSQEDLKRRGQNVYSGFVSPKFIPDRIHPVRTEFEFTLNGLSDALVGYREVTAYFFRNRTEVYDYYKRSLIRLCS